jgi:hypothetical protein
MVRGNVISIVFKKTYIRGSIQKKWMALVLSKVFNALIEKRKLAAPGVIA